jgi:hypothetical protein
MACQRVQIVRCHTRTCGQLVKIAFHAMHL